MHISFITPEYPHPKATRSGGLGTSIKNLSLSLVSRGIEVSVFIAYQAFSEIIEEDGIVLHFIAAKHYRIANWFFYKKHLSSYINKVIRIEKIDLIEAPDWTGITAFVKISIPLVVRLNGSDTYFCHLAGRSQKKKNFFLEKKNLFKATKAVSCSDFTAEVTKRLFRYPKFIQTIYNGIDTNQFEPKNTEVQANTILYYGAVIRKKGVLDLAQAFNHVIQLNPEAQLIILGKDIIDHEENVSTLALVRDLLSKEAKEMFTYVGEVSYAEVGEYISKAQVVCLPSYAEAFPMTWLETLSMEKALVSSDIGWAQELMVSGVTGYTVTPSAHEEMAKKIVKILLDPEKAIKFGRAGRNRVQKLFATDVIVQQNIDLYQAVLDS